MCKPILVVICDSGNVERYAKHNATTRCFSKALFLLYSIRSCVTHILFGQAVLIMLGGLAPLHGG